MKKIVIVTSLCLAGAGVLTYKMLGLAEVECSLCVDFNGQSACQTAYGPTRLEAIEEAMRSACARISAGVTQVLACQRAPRRDVVCSVDP